MAQAVSIVSTATAPSLTGVWLHDPTNSESTISNFIYGNVGRTESISVAANELKFIGRALPVYDMGGFESQELEIDILIPAGSTEQDSVDWFRAALRARRILCYRDNRGRLIYGIVSSINFEDRREGTGVDFTFNTTDYTEAI